MTFPRCRDRVMPSIPSPGKMAPVKCFFIEKHKAYLRARTHTRYIIRTRTQQVQSMRTHMSQGPSAIIHFVMLSDKPSLNSTNHLACDTGRPTGLVVRVGSSPYCRCTSVKQPARVGNNAYGKLHTLSRSANARDKTTCKKAKTASAS
jgi:hypothetical protein